MPCTYLTAYMSQPMSLAAPFQDQILVMEKFKKLDHSQRSPRTWPEFV